MTVAAAVLENTPRTRRRTVLAAPVQVHVTQARFALIPTAWGDCGVLWRTSGVPGGNRSSAFEEESGEARLCRLAMPGMSPPRLRAALQAYALKEAGVGAAEVLGDGHGRFPRQLVPTWLPELAQFLREFFSDSLRDGAHNHFVDVWSIWRPHLDLGRLSPFCCKVLDAVARIPSGEVRSYGEIARQVGRPAAARAVGAVMRTNPWPILVPCHRVVGASGELTGYSAPGRLATKKRLLKMERG